MLEAFSKVRGRNVGNERKREITGISEVMEEENDEDNEDGDDDVVGV